ncbi:ABC-2 type transport system ATP-binding protein [Shouchella lonarensis]|uniref:ABC-2 type transport system ATP-binding protein n=2 Tax=Shouchella lonarensis TaxID=1464122 RepID=A0A1G6MXI9_9BACI|nr:ABC-2 type transport system ATP-binding protein [Shouchella lonarensis]
MIKLDGVCKSFGGLTLFESIDYEFHKGKIYGVVGPNGSGKSVLFKMICGFIFPDQGKIFVAGEEVGTKKNRFPESVGIIIDGPGYLPHRTGFENLKDLSLINNNITDTDIRESMVKVGLDPYTSQKVKHYSLGMKQKLAIAQAIMEDQQVLILDEPFNALDEDSVEKVREVLRSSREEGKTIVITSHIKEDISVLCDEVVKINGNKLTKI